MTDNPRPPADELPVFEVNGLRWRLGLHLVNENHGGVRPRLAHLVSLLAALTPEQQKSVLVPFTNVTPVVEHATRKLREALESERSARAEAERERDGARALHHELLYQVGNIYPGESRHETALRYLKNAEAPNGGCAEATASPPAQGGQGKPQKHE
jgi:hypothetical protein